jgi:hypothetical protein
VAFFADACKTERDFQTMGGVLDICARQDIEGVNPGELTVAWAIPNMH